MIRFLISLLVSALAVLAAAYILPGVGVDSFMAAIWTALLLGVVNAFVRPILVLFSLPITILTLGLFLLVINALLVLLVDYLVGGFHVDGFWYALLFSLVLSLVNYLADSVMGGAMDKND